MKVLTALNISLLFLLLSRPLSVFGKNEISPVIEENIFEVSIDVPRFEAADVVADTVSLSAEVSHMKHTRPTHVDIYEMPYSMRGNYPDWHRLWLNTAVFTGAFVGTLFVLECLPEGSTNWNRASIQGIPPQKRWFRNIFKRGPEWDGDSPIFNYVLHPYAGAVYFMSARSCGFNFYRSLLYAACISTIGWEFGIEACMERPSIQDIFVTPLVGCVLGECFYKLKRNIVANDYRLFGSPVVGNVVAFLIDPVNEVFGWFGGNRTRKLHLGERRAGTASALMPALGRDYIGFSFACTF